MLRLLKQDADLGRLTAYLDVVDGPLFVEYNGTPLMLAKEMDGYLAYTAGAETDPTDEGSATLQEALDNPNR